VKLFVKGKVVNEFTGALPERAVEQWLEKAIPSPYQETLEEATRLLQSGEKERAAGLLREVLQADSSSEQARALLAALTLHEDPAGALSLVREIEEHSDQFPLAEAVRTVAGLLQTPADRLPDDPVRPLYAQAIASVAARDYDAALEHFIEVIRRNRMYEDDGSRKAVIALFRLLGDEDETTLKHRRSFSGALYA
jgi:putative thioredoxin